jgi:very-short-patch-repair endonuclease
LEKRRRWDTATESVLEDRFRALLAVGDLPSPCPQYVVRDPKGRAIARADFAFPNHKVLVELDSEAHHMDRMTFRNDRRKQNGAAVLGWTVLRYTWWDLVEQPWRVRTEVAASLEGAAQGP